MNYDSELRTMVIVFREDFILTVNLDERKQSGDCNCASHPEIKNFTLTEIESSTAVALKRVRLDGQSYLAMLSENLAHGSAPYTLKLHEMTLKDEGNGIWSTTVSENNVHTMSLK